ncbi:hypothetical protein HanRHA438_Chr17g0835781 [Helianthus annuus]|nr:hypothetical protein HanRHA438_Chr17g0835781 [Helianthus annuus]
MVFSFHCRKAVLIWLSTFGVYICFVSCHDDNFPSFSGTPVHTCNYSNFNLLIACLNMFPPLEHINKLSYNSVTAYCLYSNYIGIFFYVCWIALT